MVTMSRYTHSQYVRGWEFWKLSQGSPEFSTWKHTDSRNVRKWVSVPPEQMSTWNQNNFLDTRSTSNCERFLNAHYSKQEKGRNLSSGQYLMTYQMYEARRRQPCADEDWAQIHQLYGVATKTNFTNTLISSQMIINNTMVVS